MYAGKRQINHFFQVYYLNGMPSIEDLKEKLTQIQEAVIAKLPDIAMTVSITAKALAERNIREKGFGAMYSTHEIPAWFLHGKELNGSGTTFLKNHGVGADGSQGAAKKKRRKKGETADPGSYDTMVTWAEFRQAQGLPIDFVDLGYSNKMWADMSPVEVKQESDGRIVAYLGGRTRENQDKMNYNRDRYGDFINLGLGKESKDILAQVVIDELINLIEQFQIE